MALAAEMLVAAGIAGSNKEGLTRATEALDSGRAAEAFGLMVATLGGPADFMERPLTYLPRAPIEHAVEADKNGYATAIETRDVGLAVVALGGGRTKPDDVIDHAVGITGLLPVGAEVVRGEPLAIIHARSRTSAEKAEREIRAAYTIGPTRPTRQKAIIRRIAPGS